jgi:histidinol dehydrogenase
LVGRPSSVAAVEFHFYLVALDVVGNAENAGICAAAIISPSAHLCKAVEESPESEEEEDQQAAQAFPMTKYRQVPTEPKR